MDYSPYYPSILYLYFGTLAAFFVGFGLLIYGEIYLIQQIKEFKSLLSVLFFVVLFAAIVSVSLLSVDYFKDIPNVIRNNYIVATGTAEGNDSAGQEPDARGFRFKPDVGEEFYIRIPSYPQVFHGDRFEVIYLPHTGVGAIIQKLEGEELP